MASSTYIGAPPQIKVRMPDGSQSAPLSVRRLIMVGAANIEARCQWRISAKISSGSKPPDSGTTLVAPRAMFAMM